ncbi:hypothetical protein [Hyalangium rubrum]|uniref:Lipoprotein n=1 Tax=Hyalangium rubrum TaxID=3103134 RepID=A0ABU5HHH8_9BACT|nr:hypothetical protein [Hyalangium sp. s54d21]MDY7232710.1 hypothetical protein [Hyalangium sp. s54d21]
MKTWMAAVVLALAPLVACGPSEELTQAQEDVVQLRKENATLKTKLTDMESALKRVSQERDQLKVAATRAATTPAPVAAPAPSKRSPPATRK